MLCKDCENMCGEDVCSAIEQKVSKKNQRLDDDCSLFTPKAKVGVNNDAGKLRLDLLPVDALEAVAKVLETGLSDYAPRNWELGMPWSKSYGSLLRHLFKYWRKVDTDSRSAQLHMAHVACRALFLLTYQLRKVGEDDRP